MLTSRFDNGQIKYEDEQALSMIGSFRKIGLADAAIISTVEEDKALEEVFNIQRRNVYILIITLCLAFFVAYNFSVSISRPIVNLLYATNEVQKGNFDFNIEPKYNDEVGELTNSFNQMRQGLKEREKAKEALRLFINEDICKNKNKKRSKKKEIVS